MKNILKVTTICLLLAILCVCCAESAIFPGIETEIKSIEKSGNIILKVPGSVLMEAGLEYGDIVSIGVNGSEFAAKVCSNYNEVDQGEYMLRIKIDQAAGKDAATLAINAGSMAEELGIAQRTEIEADPGYKWEYCNGITEPVVFRIEMKEKGGFLDEYLVRQLSRSLDRADYPDLTDEQFANFRNIASAGMGRNVLYRSSSPINPKINRNLQADEAVKAHGIMSVINLSESEAEMKTLGGYQGSFYSQLDVIALDLGMDFASDRMCEGMAKAVRFINTHEGPYLIHCLEGKDRTGFFAMVFECLMGASGEELIGDYMKSYYNFYGVLPDTRQYDAIVRSNLLVMTENVLGITDVYAADVSEKAVRYLLDCGLSAEEIDTLRGRLGMDIDRDA